MIENPTVFDLLAAALQETEIDACQIVRLLWKTKLSARSLVGPALGEECLIRVLSRSPTEQDQQFVASVISTYKSYITADLHRSKL